MFFIKKLFPSPFLLLILFTNASAGFTQNCSFNGLGDGSSWSDPLNWDCGFQPNPAINNITIPAGFSVINDISLDIDLDNGAALTLNGGLDMQNAKISISQPGSLFFMGNMSSFSNCSELHVVNFGEANIQLGADVNLDKLKVDDEGIMTINSCSFVVNHSLEVLAAGGIYGAGQITYLGDTGNYVNASTVGIYGCTIPGVGNCPLGNCAILAAEMTRFECRSEQPREVTLLWSTASETNTDFFTIERSIDLIHWEEVERVQAAGNSVETIEYSIIDLPKDIGNLYYRNKLTDIGGALHYSHIISTRVSQELFVYPNPANKFVILSQDDASLKEISITNSMGQMIQLKPHTVSKTGNDFRLDISSLAAGSYILSVGHSQSKRFIILR